MTDGVGEYRWRKESGLSDWGGRREEGTHELLVQRDYELDEAVVERLVFCISSSFDQREEMSDERLLERGQLDRTQALNSTNFVKH